VSASYRKTRTPGIYVRHGNGCPAAHTDGPRCRCTPSYRAQVRGRGWSPTFKDRNAAMEWKSSTKTVAEAPTAGPTFGALAREWWAGVESGSTGKRKGRKGDGYSATTLADYSNSLHNILLPVLEHRDAASLDEAFWQAWVDKQSRNGLSRSRIANLLAVVSAIYGWGSRATRRIVPRNPTLAVELPPNDEKPRERVATAEEAAALLDALPPDVRVPYALAFYAGLRRSEIHRLEWSDVDLPNLTITVRQSKSDAGTGRVVPIAAPLVAVLIAAAQPDGRPLMVAGAGPKPLNAITGRVCSRSVMSGKLAEAARKAWEACPGCRGKGTVIGPPERRPELPGVDVFHDIDCPECEGSGKTYPHDPIGLHECRHTYASLLVAAGYNLKEVMSFLGHADLTTTSRYVKRLPQPGEQGVGDRLNRYLAVA